MKNEQELLNEVLEEMPQERVDELHEILLNTQEQCQMMEHLIKNQIEVKDEMINKLHKELEGYKQDAAERFVNQLMKDVIKLRKKLRRVMNEEGWETMSADELRREYTYVFEDLTDLLEQQNVDEYSTKQGSFFDASIHQTKVEPIDDIALDKTIKESISEGYTRGDKVLIPERVITYQYKEQ